MYKAPADPHLLVQIGITSVFFDQWCSAKQDSVCSYMAWQPSVHYPLCGTSIQDYTAAVFEFCIFWHVSHFLCFVSALYKRRSSTSETDVAFWISINLHVSRLSLLVAYFGFII
ncbi:hypothetical protein XELAEV_18024412mg [Xenopus laevis]|uniref:Uncharacterized protein n=1 Tax=Xenopus laevis TaxID=8355 RepID=A0A974HL93_XENLA|nr:hypothetical protein XELAEV_18024412mg [Xenopus laevis]